MLDETMCGCRDNGAKPEVAGHEPTNGCKCEGLTMRGKHLLAFGPIEFAQRVRRVEAEAVSSPPPLAFLPRAAAAVGGPEAGGAQSWLRKALPNNVKLLTMTTNYQGC